MPRSGRQVVVADRYDGGEVSAITGQSRDMVADYSRQVYQRKLVASAILVGGGGRCPP